MVSIAETLNLSLRFIERVFKKDLNERSTIGILNACSNIVASTLAIRGKADV